MYNARGLIILQKGEEMNNSTKNMEGLIYFEDGTVFKGQGFGFCGTQIGEIVFNTSMTGYQKILTDPSYKGQIITLTYPLVGNYGISDIDFESDGIHAFGLVVKDLCEKPSNSNCVKTLSQWLEEEKIPGVWGVDTRKITRKIRTTGTAKCLISTEGISISKAKELLEAAEMRGDWMKVVSTKEKYTLEPIDSEAKYEVAVLDFGVKTNILKCMQRRGCRLTVYPYGAKASEILAADPDGIFLTNGPGDPAEATEAVEEIKNLIGETDKPIFGICMGHQLLALAVGGKTYKLKYGHRGGNHGVFDKETGKSYITSQNHGYAVQHESIILKGMEVTHINLNDGTVEGMEHRDMSIFSVQFHPEASPGPNENEYLFDKFVARMEAGKEKK